MPYLVSEVNSDRRATRASRACHLPGFGARARASGSGGRAQPAARRIMSHGRVTIFGALTGSQPARIQHRIHASIGKFHACSHACMHDRLPGWLAAKIVPVAMRHDAAGSWLRAPAGPGSARARTRARQGPGPAGARGAAVRIDF